MGYKPTTDNDAKTDLDPHLLGEGNKHLPVAGSTTFEVNAKELFYKRPKMPQNMLLM